jgi:N-terminal domain of anti-restriction factor ArdC
VRTMRPTTGASSTRAEQLVRAHELLAARLAELQSSDDWRAALDVAARFHRYSFGNALLIAAQHDDAYQRGLVPDPLPGYVAGFHTWKVLGRHVEKGQKGYVILCPSTRLVREATTADGTRRPLTRGESARPHETVTSRKNLVGWTTGHVFALSQTSGTDLPAPPTPRLLAGAAPVGLWDGLAARANAAGFAVSLVSSAAELGGANGVTDFSTRTVRVRADMDPAAQVKTLSHELAHALLHAPPSQGGALVAGCLDRRLAEVEAESVAYLVGSAHGMDTTGYSLPYVASWAGGADPAAVVRATAEQVIGTARDILTDLDTAHTSGGAPPGIREALARRPATSRREPQPQVVFPSPRLAR